MSAIVCIVCISLRKTSRTSVNPPKPQATPSPGKSIGEMTADELRIELQKQKELLKKVTLDKERALSEKEVALKREAAALQAKGQFAKVIAELRVKNNTAGERAGVYIHFFIF